MQFEDGFNIIPTHLSRLRDLLTHKELSKEQRKACEPALKVIDQLKTRIEEEAKLESMAVCKACIGGCEVRKYLHLKR